MSNLVLRDASASKKKYGKYVLFLFDKRMSAFALVILFVFWILPVLHIRGENLGTIFGICTPGLAKVDRGEGWIRMIINGE